MDSIHVALSAETIGYFLGIPITNTLIMSWIVVALLVSIAVLVGRKPRLVPSRMQIFLEMIITGVHDFMRETLENDKIARRYLPLLVTVFLFIATANLIEFTPGIGSIGFYPPQEQAAHDVSRIPTATAEIVSPVANPRVVTEPHDTVTADTSSEIAAREMAADTHAVSKDAPTSEKHAPVFIPLLRSMNTDISNKLADELEKS